MGGIREILDKGIPDFDLDYGRNKENLVFNLTSQIIAEVIKALPEERNLFGIDQSTKEGIDHCHSNGGWNAYRQEAIKRLRGLK